MVTVKQSVYDDFVCIADKCPDTCCKGWEIGVDEEAMQRFKDYNGPMKTYIDWAVDYKKGVIRFDRDGMCSLLNSAGLCSLVLEEGEDFICDICHTYPRHVEEYEGVREYSLSLSCPYATHLIVSEEKASYKVEEDDTPDPLEEDFEDFDLLLYTKIEDSRNVLYSIIQMRRIPLIDRMRLCLTLADKLQELLNADEIYKMDDIISEWSQLNFSDIDYSDIIAGIIPDTYDYFCDNYTLLEKMELLRDDWTDILRSARKLIMIGREGYEKAVAKCCDPLTEKNKEHYLENVLMAQIYTYYLGAVYDDSLYAKVAMSVFFVLMAEFLTLAEGMDSKLGISPERYEMIIYRLAREFEHSDVNLDLADKWFS